MADNRGVYEAAAMDADRDGPPLWHVFSPQQGRVSHKTQEAAHG
ncbi:hypothetical protein LY12_000273 [Prauserella alba]|nr:hypothetical protein [Prauserella alba]